MAAGDTLCVFTALNNTYAGTTAALPDRRNQHPVLIFDQATDWIADFHGVMPNHYGGGGTAIVLAWTSPLQTGACTWNAAWERISVSSDDYDVDNLATALAVTEACNGTSGRMTFSTISFTAGAAMDLTLAGHAFRLRITRDADNASDTMASNAELWTVHIYET